MYFPSCRVVNLVQQACLDQTIILDSHLLEVAQVLLHLQDLISKISTKVTNNSKRNEKLVNELIAFFSNK
jgi:hypothetical protein